MTEGTAKVQKMKADDAAKKMQTVVTIKKGKVGDVVFVVPISEKGKYLVITIPKGAVEEKLKEVAKLPKEERADELLNWLKINRNNAVLKYVNSKETDFTFTVSDIPTPQKKGKKKEEPKKAKYTFTAPKGIKEKDVKSKGTTLPETTETKPKKEKAVVVTVVTPTALKENEPFKTFKVTVDLTAYGAPKLSIALNVSDKEMLEKSDKKFEKTVDMIVDMALKEAKKKGIEGSYKISKYSSVETKTLIKKKIGPVLYDKRIEMLKMQKKKKAVVK